MDLGMFSGGERKFAPDTFDSTIWKDVLKHERKQALEQPRKPHSSNAGFYEMLGNYHDEALKKWRDKSELAGRPPFVRAGIPLARWKTADSGVENRRGRIEKHNALGFKTGWEAPPAIELQGPIVPKAIPLDLHLSRSFRKRNLIGQLVSLRYEELKEVMDGVRKRLDAPAKIRPESAPSTRREDVPGPLQDSMPRQHSRPQSALNAAPVTEQKFGRVFERRGRPGTPAVKDPLSGDELEQRLTRRPGSATFRVQVKGVPKTQLQKSLQAPERHAGDAVVGTAANREAARKHNEALRVKLERILSGEQSGPNGAIKTRSTK